MPYLLYCSIPKELENAKKLLSRVRNPLKSQGLKPQSLHSSKYYVLVLRCADEDLNDIVANLLQVGLGKDFGEMNVVMLDASIPEISPINKDNHKAHKPSELLAYQLKIAGDLNAPFMINIMLAAIIAGMGLIGNSSVVVVSSMLISPLMGPILSFTFATLTGHRSLSLSSLGTEMVGILICFVVGFSIGLCSAPFAHQLNLPTQEMSARGEISNLIFGVFIALASGVAVSLAITNNSINSLVGVAISASLLPPVVNTGICLALGILLPVLYPESNESPITGTNTTLGVTDTQVYHISGISFALFCVNVACIYVACLLSFLVSRLQPTKTRTPLWDYFEKNEEMLNTSYGRTPRPPSRKILTPKMGNDIT